MALTKELNNVIECGPDINIDTANMEMAAEMISFYSRPIKLIDVGAGDSGSGVVNIFRGMSPDSQVTYVDRHHEFLSSIRSSVYPMIGTRDARYICTDATRMSFNDDMFDIAYAGYVISHGVMKNHHIMGDNSYNIVNDVYRILKKTGLFIFTQCMENKQQTLDSLHEIGFRRLRHMQRMNHKDGIPIDTYAAMK